MHLLHVFPSFQVGGSQRRFAALANHFARKPAGPTLIHTVVSLDGCFDAGGLLAPETRCRLMTVKHSSNPLAAAVHARRALRDLRPDLLVTYNWGAVDWAAAVDPQALRHVHIEDGFGPEEATRQLRRRVWYRRVVLNRGSTVVLPSQTLARIATETWRIDPAHVLYLPNGIPCERFKRPARAPLRATFRGEGPVVGTVAALRKEKALDRLIAAFAKARRPERPMRLVIVGDGAERARLEALATELHLTDCVTFTGALEHPERALAAFDLFALSSDTEQMPFSILEAMAAGLAIASTDAGDVPGMVAEENRPYVVAKDADALSGALGRLLDDSGTRATLGAANRARAVAVFDDSTMFAAYEKLFLDTREPSYAAAWSARSQAMAVRKIRSRSA